MAFLQHSAADLSHFTHRIFGALRRSAPAGRPSVYRCASCGDEIPFDALAATCRCTEECYSSLTAVAGAVAEAVRTH